MSFSSPSSAKAKCFDRAYRAAEMYYGWEVRPEFERFFGNMDLTGRRALDLGAGEGRYSIFMARRGCAVTAVDFSSAGLDKLKILADQERLPVVAQLCDLADYAFPRAAFDVVVAATILDHLETDPRNRAMAGMVSALKPGGLLYVNVFTTEDPGYAAGSPDAEGVSDTAFGMAYYFEPGELKSCFPGLTLLDYYEGIEKDTSHGKPHHHGWASLIAKKE
ncbi:MAG: class I SAM-dependent methyltransferase [Thermodesulfobacteriota bacterium]